MTPALPDKRGTLPWASREHRDATVSDSSASLSPTRNADPADSVFSSIFAEWPGGVVDITEGYDALLRERNRYRRALEDVVSARYGPVRDAAIAAAERVLRDA